MILDIEKLIIKNWMSLTCRESFSRKNRDKKKGLVMNKNSKTNNFCMFKNVS